MFYFNLILAVLTLLATFLFSPSIVAGEEIDRSKYNLFHPVPHEQMRELITDRPDKTESPYTVDPGRFQFETDIFNYTNDTAETYDAASNTISRTKRREYAFNVINWKVGITSWSDLQLITSSLQIKVVDKDGIQTTKHGYGDTYIRYKINIFGNDSGDLSVGVMAVLKLPTSAQYLGNKQVEGGVMIPLLAMTLPHGFDLGTMMQVNRNKNTSDSHYHTELVSSVSVAHLIYGKLSGYVEFFSQATNEPGGEWVATLDSGLLWQFAKNFQVDMGFNLGLTTAADDLNPFIGFSAKF